MLDVFSDLARLSRTLFLRQPALSGLVFFLAADLFFILLHTSYLDIGMSSHNMAWLSESLGAPLGLAAFYTAGKYAVICGLFIVSALVTRRVIFAALTVAIAAIALDDMLELHETVGMLVSESWLNFAPGPLRSQDLGELIGFAMLAVIAGAPLLMAWLRADRSERLYIVLALVFIASAAFCAVVIDVLHQAASTLFGKDSFISEALFIAEDGGEMIAISFLAGLALAAFPAGIERTVSRTS
ncbi:hypothetical protein GQ651_10960 [Alphaproteobacteria bacterium GH1-50]|uniref:Uncharacterized protein n=1 Tax=Kangsaoukella pontilimi TaxID=2691042 RepID=A0A7C9ISW1_9RHOB|nr:hypothetical protein [Kangsaoukella pontilimi]MXQ08365.1 hypothetical protein [Kangsaoukella pontilimi]